MRKLRATLKYCSGLAFLSFGVLNAAPSWAQENQTSSGAKENKEEAFFVNDERVNSFLNSLGDTTRDTAQDRTQTRNALKMVLDVRLPVIFETCDLRIRHEILLLAYAYASQMPGSKDQLKIAADGLVRRKPEYFRGVSPACQAALRGFGVAVLRVELGDDWGERDEIRMERALGRDR